MAILQDLLGIELPILQAPMAGVQGSALAVAVCEAGGLGALPCAMLGPDAMREELEAIRARTSKPYNVNFFCHTPPEFDAVRDAAWRAVLAPYYEEYGIDPESISGGAGRAPFSPEAAGVLEDFRPAVVSFHFGSALGRPAGAGAGVGGEDPLLGDHGRGGGLAGGARGGRDRRAGPGGGRASRAFPVGRPDGAARNLRAGAADRAGGEGAGDRRRRHRGRAGRGRRPGGSAPRGSRWARRTCSVRNPPRARPIARP